MFIEKEYPHLVKISCMALRTMKESSVVESMREVIFGGNWIFEGAVSADPKFLNDLAGYALMLPASRYQPNASSFRKFIDNFFWTNKVAKRMVYELWNENRTTMDYSILDDRGYSFMPLMRFLEALQLEACS